MIQLFLFLILLLYFGAVLYLYFKQNSLIFNFTFVEKKEPKILKECNNCKRVKLQNKGVLLDGVYLKNGSSKLIIYFGGNSDDATDILEILKEQKEYDVVAFNYRGNALSSGKPSENSLYEDALKIYDAFAKDKEVVLIGRSLGSGVAAYLASKREVKKLILITPYDSIENVAKEKYPFIMPISLLLKYKFNTIEHIKKCKTPTIIFMVKDDKVVSNKRTKNLIKYINNLLSIKEFLWTTHGDILSNEEFKKELLKSLS